MRIDVHSHYYPANYLDTLEHSGADVSVARRAAGYGVSLDERTALLQRAGIRVQVLSVGTEEPYFPDTNAAVRAARMANDLYAEVCHVAEGQFAAFACLPLPHVDAAMQELQRALELPGMLGVILGCSIAGRPLDDPAFEPLFAELDRRGAVVFLHPLGIGAGPLVEGQGLNIVLGAPFEDTAAALRLVVSGITTRYPRLRIIVPHLGGTLPFLVARMDEGLTRRLGFAPSEHLRRMWFDTLGNHPAALRCACESFGADRLLLGTDFPHLTGERFDRCLSYVQQADLAAEQRTAILERNAQALLGLADR